MSELGVFWLRLRFFANGAQWEIDVAIDINIHFLPAKVSVLMQFKKSDCAFPVLSLMCVLKLYSHSHGMSERNTTKTILNILKNTSPT